MLHPASPRATCQHGPAGLHLAAPRVVCQHGAAALVVTLLLFFAMALAALYVNRNLTFEQRSAANLMRSTQAFEAAEAGLEWALAQLNGNRRIGADCEPSADPSAGSFRSRYLKFDRSTHVFAPATLPVAGALAALTAACVRSAQGWACSCPTAGAPALDAPAGAAAAPAFVVQFLPTGRAGVVRVSSTGCTSLGGACRPGAGAGARADATARVEAAFGLLGALRTAPAATLTVLGAVDAGGASIGFANTDPATGWVVQAGGAIAAPAARLTAAPGRPTADTLVDHDPALAGLDADRFFRAHFGADAAGWQRRPGVTRLACHGDCTAALAAAVAAAADSAVVWIDGDVALNGPVALGSADRPALIVARGTLRLAGDVSLTGVLYAGAVEWRDTTGGAGVLGAVLSERGYTGYGAPELIYGTDALARLTAEAGVWARVSGSWRDF